MRREKAHVPTPSRSAAAYSRYQERVSRLSRDLQECVAQALIGYQPNSFTASYMAMTFVGGTFG